MYSGEILFLFDVHTKKKKVFLLSYYKNKQNIFFMNISVYASCFELLM